MMAVVWEGGLHALLSLASTHMMLHSATIECLLYAVPIPKQSIFRYNILSMCATRLGMNISGVQTTPCIVSHFCCHFQWWILPLMSYFLLCYISDAVPSMKQMQGLGGNVCPARALRATFLLTIPTSAPDLPSHGEAPQVNHIALHTFPTKHVA